MKLTLTKKQLKGIAILTLFTAFLVIISYVFGYYNGIEHANSFFQNYITKECLCGLFK